MFQCYNATGDDTDRKIKFTAYWDVLSDLPSDVIVSVCRKASRGEIGEPGFLPSAGELYRAATASCNSGRRYPMLNEPARTIPRDERARIIHGFNELKAEIVANKHQQAVPGWMTLGEAMQLKEWNHPENDDKPLPKLSDELRKKLGCGIPKIET
jgi:hypothetical protein